MWLQSCAPHAALQGRLLEVRLRQGPVVDDVLARRLTPGRCNPVRIRAEAGIGCLLLRVCQLHGTLSVISGVQCCRTSMLSRWNL